VAVKEDWMRWNDYGMDCFAGDLRMRGWVSKSDGAIPPNPDGWVNIGRVRTQEGDNAARCRCWTRHCVEAGTRAGELFLCARVEETEI